MAEDHSKNKLLDVLDIEEREQLRSLMEEITVRPEEVLWGKTRISGSYTSRQPLPSHCS
jgi:hypothetical protein